MFSVEGVQIGSEIFVFFLKAYESIFEMAFEMPQNERDMQEVNLHAMGSQQTSKKIY